MTVPDLVKYQSKSLRIAGVLEQCNTFVEPLRLEQGAEMPIETASVRSYMEENLAAAIAVDDLELIDALKNALR